MNHILKDLNKEQKEAVTTTEDPLLIIAGAGTGKTTVITIRIAYLIAKKLAKPAEILALTFTDKAANEMEERVDVLVPYGFIDTWISTFHSFGARILRDHALELGIPPDFKILTRPQQILFFQQNLFNFPLEYYRPLGNPTKFFQALITFISRCKDEEITFKDLAKFTEKLKKKLKKTKKPDEKSEIKQEIEKFEELTKTFKKYEELKTQAGFLDFGDLIILTLALFRKFPKILKAYCEKFKYVLVDEFQDTNWAQLELLKLLVPPQKNICVVADDDQSIYRWRSASLYNIYEFQKIFKNCKIINLTTNFRSTQAILNAAYKLIQHNNPNRLEVQSKIPKKLKSVKTDYGIEPIEIFTPTLSEQSDKVAEEIKKLVTIDKIQDTRKKKITQNGGKASLLRSAELTLRQAQGDAEQSRSIRAQNYQYRDIAILARTNAQAEFFVKALEENNIPVKFAGAGFYNLPEIKTLVSFLKSITTFDDNPSLFHLLTSEIYNFPIKEAIKLTDLAKRRNLNLKTVLENLEKYQNQLDLSREAATLVEKINSDLNTALEQSRKRNVGQVLYSFLQSSKYLEKLQNEGSAETVSKVANTGKFFEKITEFLRTTRNVTPAQFLDFLETTKGIGGDTFLEELDPDLNAVAVMTIHTAKGLEFPVVFMVDLIAERFPSRERSEPIEVPQELVKEKITLADYHLEEERRLFYVGATRAADLLYFCWSPDVGGKRLQKPSPFVLEALDRPFTKPIFEVAKPVEKISKFAKTPKIQVVPNLSEELVLKLSSGAVEDFLTCEYKYRYVHVLRIPILRHHAVVYGAALHYAVAAFWRAKQAGKTLTLPQLLEIFENAWISEGFLSATHEEKRLTQGKLVLEKFWKREKDTEDLPTYIEKEFQIKIDGVMLRGRWDRVDVKNGKVTILDYKSSENVDQKKADFDTKNSIQLAIYALAYFDKFKKIPDNLALYFLESGIVGNYKPDKNELEETRQKILEVAAKVRLKLKDDSFIANPVYFGREPACVYCAYNTICPFSLTK